MIIEQLSKQTGLSGSQLNHYATTASKRYKTYQIEKRNGKYREISQPSKEIKALQRWLNRTLLRRMPIHESATAYSKGSSIRANAARHMSTNFTLRIDFKDFFPSFSLDDVSRFVAIRNIEMGIGLNNSDIAFIANIVSRNGKLTIGAPSSPILTNAMMYDFDRHVEQWAIERGVIYTRYADDIFLSCRNPEPLHDGTRTVLDALSNFQFGSLKINVDKTTFLSRKARRTITGLVITPEYNISIGRSRKREIRTLIYLHGLGKLETERLSYLRGLLAFIADVEPAFREALASKFGAGLLTAIQEGSTKLR